ncbi:SH3 domain-containing protein [Paenibacillus sp. An7]|uniref:SH3 domain-containing protein n=1 Tax=Paenibacillus sp. An7 TaxID=2689577 RepID=UPI00135AF3EA|nr:SH3 domain-containing protein [Paenibacillus sp. An7]
MSTIAETDNSPREQFYELLDLFDKEFLPDVSSEISAFVYKMRNHKFDLIEELINNRIRPINDLVKQGDPKLDRKARFMLFIEKLKPNDLAKDLEKMLSLDQLFDEYERFIKRLGSKEYGKALLKYQLDPHLKLFLKSEIYKLADEPLRVLKEYAKSVEDFAALLDRIRNSVGEKRFFKIGASILGGSVGGIAGSLAARGIASLLMSDEDKIIRSTDRIANKYDEYDNTLSNLLVNFEYAYLHTVATLFGGTLLHYEREIRSANLYINQLNMLEFNFTICLREQQLKEVKLWAKSSIHEIKSYIAKKDTTKALEASNKFYQVVQNNPVLKMVAFGEKFSLIYLANLYKYSALVLKANELKSENELSFLGMITEVYKQMPYMVHDEDLKALGVTEQTDILLEWIQLCFKHNKEDQLTVLLDYGQIMFGRILKYEFFSGELTRENCKIDLEIILYILTTFVEEKQHYTHPIMELYLEIKYAPSISSLREMERRYTVFKRNDKFHSYIKKVFFPLIAGRTVRIIKISLLPLYNKKTRGIILAVLLLILVGGLGYSQHEKIQSGMTSFKQTVKDFPSVFIKKAEIRYLTITTSQANVRSDPSLDSESLYILNQQDQLEYVDEQHQDIDGRLWYKVLLLDGRIGWISSKTVQWN